MTEPALQQAHLEIKGHVQGVNFRNTVRHLAYPLGLKGFAENNADDEELVHIMVEGPGSAIDKLVDYLQRMKMELPAPGVLVPPRSLIHVESIQIRRKEVETPTFKAFSVKKPAGIEGKLDDVINKLDFGATVYAAFHQDHNQNFFYPAG